jgi:pimeloyl-ACP methyl ester carboxylesterase
VAFHEGFVEADGFRIRYLEAGAGPPLVCLHGAAGLVIGPAHDLLAQSFRLIAFETPGFGASENTRTRTVPELAATMSAAIERLGLDRFALLGTCVGASTALWVALRSADRVGALVLESPTAISPAAPPDENSRRSFAHPERVAAPAPDPPAHATTLVDRLRGPGGDADLDLRLPELAAPTLVLFGTEDSVISPAAGRVYKQRLANAHLVFVYDAGHAIAADRPEAFAEVVADFVERGEAFAISRANTVIHP